MAMFALSLPLTIALAPPALAERHHGISVFGQLKYPPDFKHFDYVNPDAPKGGEISTYGGQGFDTFNAFILKGDKAQGLNLLYDSLLIGSDDEPSSAYGLVAEAVEVAQDKNSVTFYMRPQAKFSDGTAIVAADAVFTFDTLKSKGHPEYRFILRDIIKAEAVDRLTVRYTFQGDLVRDLPLAVGSLPILSKAYFETHDFAKTTLQEAPLGSGPYLLADYKSSDYVAYKRRNDYWARNLPVNVGRYNFDTVKFKYAKDRGASFIAFTAGEYTLREEFTSKRWATEYNFPAVADGRVKLLTLPDNNPSGTQGWFFNMRREKFADLRVRKAIGFAFDFEWSNKNLFFDLYKRTVSYFENSPMKAAGKPTEAELELLAPFKDRLPANVFGNVETPPVSDGSGQDRNMLKAADELLREAGWTLKNRKRVDAAGERLAFEFIHVEPEFDRVVLPFIKNLRALGIDASLRPVDAAQYERRLKSFDYDLAIQRYIMSKTPGIELRSYFSSQTAGIEGSRNLSGIENPAVDALIDKIVEANSAIELKTAVMALDRVLRAYNYWVPHWYKGAHNIAHWDQFDRPKVKPLYSTGILDTWWYDAGKAAKLNR